MSITHHYSFVSHLFGMRHDLISYGGSGISFSSVLLYHILVLCQKHPAYPARKIFYFGCGIGGMSGIKSGYDKYMCACIRTVIVFVTTVLIIVRTVLILITTVLMNMMTILIAKWVLYVFLRFEKDKKC